MSAGLIVGAFFVGILAILILIMIHELGHFIVAKLSGAYVYEFSIGFGPRIYTKKGKETWFSIRIIPLGGFVSIASDRSEPPIGREEDFDKIPDERKMDYLARWKKALFILAGPTMNFAIAIIMISIIFMATMQKANDMSFAGNKYDHDNIAYKLIADKEESIKENDQYVSITGWEVRQVKVNKDLEGKDVIYVFSNVHNNKDITDNNKKEFEKNFGNDYWIIENGKVNDLKAVNYTKIVYNFLDNFDNKVMQEREGYKTEIRFEYRLMDKNLYTQDYKNIPDSNLPSDFKLTNFSSEDNKYEFKLDGKNTKIGVAAPTRVFKNTNDAYKYSWKEMGDQSLALLKAFAMLFTGHIKQLAGPVGVANQTAMMITQPDTLFLYIAGLSANLFVLNLIPIPPLDGYKFVENAIEAALRRELKQRTKMWLYTAGAILFVVIFVVITIKDFVIG